MSLAHPLDPPLYSICLSSVPFIIRVLPDSHKVGNVDRSDIFVFQLPFYFVALVATDQFFLVHNDFKERDMTLRC